MDQHSENNNNHQNNMKKVTLYNTDSNENRHKVQIGCSNYILTDGGFLLPEDLKNETTKPVINNEPVIDYKKLNCNECQKVFYNSFLYKNFDEIVCEECRESSEDYKLITRTNALISYPLKPHDLDLREPLLKFITRRNPHSTKSLMKLYLNIQVKNRACDVWGSEGEVQHQMNLRAEHSRKIANKRLQKNTELMQKKLCAPINIEERHKSHQHTFGAEEVVDPENDVFRRKCSTCTYVEEFEKI